MSLTCGCNPPKNTLCALAFVLWREHEQSSSDTTKTALFRHLVDNGMAIDKIKSAKFRALVQGQEWHEPRQLTMFRE